MPKFRLKITSFEASRWFKNGDHTLDGDERIVGGEFDGEPAEGKIVRRFSHPDVKGSQVCDLCGKTMHEHGWIDQESPETVCPGDWVLSVPDCGYIAVDDDEFGKRFEAIQ